MFKVVSPDKCKNSAAVLQDYMNNYSDFKTEIRINWGCSKFTSPENSNVKGNTTTSVKNSVDKRLTFNLLGHMAVPRVTIPENFNGKVVKHIDPKGMGGKGVSLVKVGEFWDNNVLYTKFIEGREFRVFFAYDKIVGIAEKVPVEDIKDGDIRTAKNGYGYQVWLDSPVTGLFDVFDELVKKAQTKLGLSYGAIDFILEDSTMYVYILESNSAPCLFDNDIAEQMAITILENVYNGEE